MPLKVSIITVCFNSAKTIRDAINSVLEQSYQNIEYIVVDGASTDATIEILDEYHEDISKFVSEPDRGIYDAMNKGISIATGDVVGILNSDDIFESTHSIQQVVDQFNRTPQAQMVFGDVVFVSADDVSSIRRYYSSANFRPWKLRFGWMPPHPATFVKRHVFEQYGNYSLDYEISSDYEIFIRWLMVKKLSYARVDRVLVRMRQGGKSTAGIRSSLLLNREIVRGCVSNGIYTNLFFLFGKIPFKLLELVRRPRPKIQ